METFRRGRWGWICSSEGYAVRVLGRTHLQHRDDRGLLDLPVEAMSEPWNNIVLHTTAVPDHPERPRRQLNERMRSACDFAGLKITQEPE